MLYLWVCITNSTLFGIMTKLYCSISTYLYHSDVSADLKFFAATCDICQETKLPGPSYGILIPHNTLITPWFEVAVDLVGTWSTNIETPDFPFKCCHSLTCIHKFNVLPKSRTRYFT
jgi:hypothetical protein